MSSDCLFCKIVEGAIPADVVYQNDEVIAFRDISPQAPVHLLIIPKVHVSSVNDLTADTAALISTMVLTAKELAAQADISEDGYRLILNCNPHGGQTVYHIHLHLLGGRQLTALG